MSMHRELRGWFFSVYPDEADGAVVWLVGEDGGRYRLRQDFPVTFYLAAERDRLRAVSTYLETLPQPPRLTCTRRQELYKGDLLVLAVQVANPVAQQKLFRHLQRVFSQVRYYDAKIPFPIRYGVVHGIFPMAKCRVLVDEQDNIRHISTQDSPWDMDFTLPPLRVLRIEPAGNPRHAPPRTLTLAYEQQKLRLDTADSAALLGGLQDVLNRYDPDVLFARYGDSWLFPYLERIAEEHGIEFNAGRDPRYVSHTIKAMTFESYGSIYHRARQTHLFGRWHIDPKNSSMDMGFHFSMQSSIELARVTSVSVQTASRNSPGSGFTAMQIREALQRGVLVPLHKRQTERFKSVSQLNTQDGGGLNFRPLVGLHTHVAEVDFFSMYPSIMKTWNISGETVGVRGEENRFVPKSGVPIRQDVPGLVASVLRPLLEKRRIAKRMLKQLAPDDPQRPLVQGTTDALKWLGYVSFGYQGYKNNLFGNIQAHEAICAIGRHSLLTAMETAQQMGYRVLAANVDSLFVQKDSINAPADLQPLIDAICRDTGLVIELEGIFEWLAFLPSKLNPRVGAANRYFGKFSDGSLKVRGTAQRRSDTPAWIANVERQAMALLASQPDALHLAEAIPGVITLVHQHFAELDREEVPLEQLVCCTKLSRELEQYRGSSPSARAAAQMLACGKTVRVGQRVSFIYTHGQKSEVLAWDCPGNNRYSLINKRRYKELLARAIHQVLVPFGMSEKQVADLMLYGAQQLPLPWDEAEDLAQERCTLADVLFAPYL